MMPIYFNIESHLWILYLFFVNGALLHGIFCARSAHYSELTQSVEASVLTSFFLSIGLNGLLMLGLDLIGVSFSIILPILVGLSVLLLAWCFFTYGFCAINALNKLEYSLPRVILYVLVFIILFHNGGLIELSADSWWHLSFANQIAIESSFFLEQGHLNGVASRYYPPLWHGNLALATVVSDISLSVLWNSFTAWGAVLKVMGFYLLALGLTRQPRVALISTILFVLLPGMGNSYLRVSAWPSHVAYAAWFYLFYASFFYFDKYAVASRFAIKSFVAFPFKVISITLLLIFLMLVILLTHQLELVWFLGGFIMYTIACALTQCLSKKRQTELQNDWFFFVGLMSLLVVIACSVYFLVTKWHRLDQQVDLLIAYFLPTMFCVFIVLSLLLEKMQWLPKVAVVVRLTILALVGLLLLSIDVRQLLSLFKPELSYSMERYHEMALIATGLFGGELKVPGWHLQLRGGLLYSGVIGVVLSMILAFTKPSRASYFLAGNAVLAFLFCISPYLYQWLQWVMHYHSPWRISMLIFHPIIFAICVQSLWSKMVGKRIR